MFFLSNKHTFKSFIDCLINRKSLKFKYMAEFYSKYFPKIYLFKLDFYQVH